jgi:hypothetical protein
MAHMQQLGLQDTLDSQQPIWSQRLDTDSIEVAIMAMDTTLAAAWSSYQQHPYRQLGSSNCEGRTLLCYAQYFQYFLNINSSTARRHVYHNIPASAWEPVMQIATGRLRLRSVTAHWHGPQRSDSSCCPCCPGATEDPAHYVWECPAYSTIRDQYVHISQAAAAVDGGEDVSRAMLQLFVPSHLQELAAFLRKAYRLRFPRNGSLGLTTQVATDGANAPAGGDGDVDTDDGSTSGDDDSDDDSIFLDNSGLNTV